MKYSYILHTPEKNIKIANADLTIGEKQFCLDAYTVTVKTEKAGGYLLTNVTVQAENEADVYLSLMGEGEAELYSFAGLCKDERIFRQSPHDVTRYHFKMERSAIPMIAAVTENGTDLFMTDNPSYFDNATTQHIIPEEKTFYLSSGDKGGTPNNEKSDPFGPIFHHIDKNTTHTLRFVTIKTDADNLKTIRRAAFLAIEKVWGSGSDSLYRAMCFGSNYMHIRKNETGRSPRWVVAGIEYATPSISAIPSIRRGSSATRSRQSAIRRSTMNSRMRKIPSCISSGRTEASRQASPLTVRAQRWRWKQSSPA